MMTPVRCIHVRALSGRARSGLMRAGGITVPCRLGRSGLKVLKREGDGATPKGRFPLCRVYYRADRARVPRTGLASVPTNAEDGWCDAPDDRNYNRFIRRPYPARHERLWRDDGVYDLIVVLGHNARPRLRGRGSAVFLHLSAEDGRPTEGCVAVSRSAMRRILALCGPRTAMRIW